MADAKEIIAGYVILTGTVEAEEEGGFTSVCLELGVASCGDTVEKALDMLGEAIDCQLEGLADLGILEREFRERNIETQQDEPSQDKVTVKVAPETIIRVYPRKIPALAAA